MKTYNLPKTNGKAKIFIREGKEVLLSFNKEVAEYDPSNGKMAVKDVNSPTTLKHLKLFLEINNFPTILKN